MPKGTKILFDYFKLPCLWKGELDICSGRKSSVTSDEALLFSGKIGITDNK